MRFLLCGERCVFDATPDETFRRIQQLLVAPDDHHGASAPHQPQTLGHFIHGKPSVQCMRTHCATRSIATRTRHP
jgi:hypothetical protein